MPPRVNCTFFSEHNGVIGATPYHGHRRERIVHRHHMMMLEIFLTLTLFAFSICQVQQSDKAMPSNGPTFGSTMSSTSVPKS